MLVSWLRSTPLPVSMVALLASGCGTLQSSGSTFPTGEARPVVGIHTLELAEGVTTEQFERFVTGPFSACFEEPVGGLEVRIEKCDRGRDLGMYCAVWVFDSVARRNSYFPEQGPPTASFEDEVASRLPDAWDRLWEMCRSVEFTDYIVMHSSQGPDSSEPSLYGVHDFTLAEGVTPETFEAFVTGPFAEAWSTSIAGMGREVLIGDRGERAGQYQNVFVFTPASMRDEFFPTPSTQSATYTRDVQPLLPGDVWDAMKGMTVRESYSDWGPVR